jgi:hypothetical protein
VPVDTALTRAPDGTLTTKATTVGLAFSGGGTGPLTRVSLGAAELALSWPAPLRAPGSGSDCPPWA